MRITAEEFEALCDEIWTVAIGLPLVAVGPLAAPGSGALRDGYAHTGQVALTGAWTGAVQVELSGALARRVTAEMLGLEPDELEGEDVADAVGELANMIGGNLKARLPGGCELSLPSVTAGHGYEMSVRGSKAMAERCWRWGEEPLVTRLLEGATG